MEPISLISHGGGLKVELYKVTALLLSETFRGNLSQLLTSDVSISAAENVRNFVFHRDFGRILKSFKKFHFFSAFGWLL